MDRLDAMRVFIAVAEEESFARAARRLGMSAPVATRAVGALEERLGARLFSRTTRIVRLTQAGERFFSDCRRILSELSEAEASAAGVHGEPSGELSVTAPVMFGRLFIAPLLLDFLDRYPSVVAQTLFVDRIVDLINEGQDVAVRIANLPDSSLTAIRCGSVRHVLCAAPQFLARHGIPSKPADLSELEAVELSMATPRHQWPFEIGGKTATVRIRPRLVANTVDVAITAALSGRAIARVLSYQITEELSAGKLQIVLAEYEQPPLPIHIVYHGGRRAGARVRRFVDFAVETLRENPSLHWRD
ncbi:LysR family transcriptional regulator [Brucella pituitosa]|uniref:LysR family transcriptional regulator n=1 Tax=Brucella pituitosa TaxID=571256 RepID=UPI003C70A82F